jgi:hypothetical protein
MFFLILSPRRFLRIEDTDQIVSNRVVSKF